MSSSRRSAAFVGKDSLEKAAHPPRRGRLHLCGRRHASRRLAARPQSHPNGYTFCGWSNFDGSWTMTDPEPGVYLVAFADGMTCRSARRNVNRVRYSKTPPYRPLRTGYRCRTLASQHEYADVRCIKVGGTRKFRFRTGA